MSAQSKKERGHNTDSPFPLHEMREVLVCLPETWNYLLSFYVFFKKAIKVSQSTIVPRVRSGDPSGVAPGKVEGFFSAPGHPWKLLS